MNLKPLNDRVLVKRVEEELSTPSGLILSTPVDRPDHGKVLAVGSKVLEVVAGNKVLFGKFAGQSVKFEGEDFLMIKEEDILAVIGGE
ncbi:co-chaperone GroES [Methylotenera sp.]|uniref:co-chaperone GroES n=1 Tax=Methylotenera sp. TaxID=2051956 RepID=UPI002488AAFE|nr:co-chaperone GroES [Methylotenera sp.]MDI1360635.1 co-chaperone GroES [Methylotenera sp.]